MSARAGGTGGGTGGGPAARPAARPVVRRKGVSRFVAPAVAVLAIFGAYGATSAAGIWQSSGRVPLNGQSIAPADLRGWMTVQQAADGLGMDVPTLLSLTGADAATLGSIGPQTPLNELEAKIPGFSVTTLRTAVTNYREHGTVPSASPSALPTSAAPSAGTPRPSGSGTGSGAGSGSGTRTGTSSGTASVTGQMTLKQVSDTYGVPLPDLIAKAGLPADVATNVPLRNLKDTVPGFEVTAVRDAVTALKG